MSTGSFVPGVYHEGKSTAVRMADGPASMNCGAGCGRLGSCANEAMLPVTPAFREICTVTWLVASVRLVTTVVPPPALAVWTPGSVTTALSPAGP
jgi:hypothetical protein